MKNGALSLTLRTIPTLITLLLAMALASTAYGAARAAATLYEITEPLATKIKPKRGNFGASGKAAAAILKGRTDNETIILVRRSLDQRVIGRKVLKGKLSKKRLQEALRELARQPVIDDIAGFEVQSTKKVSAKFQIVEPPAGVIQVRGASSQSRGLVSRASSQQDPPPASRGSLYQDAELRAALDDLEEIPVSTNVRVQNLASATDEQIDGLVTVLVTQFSPKITKLSKTDLEYVTLISGGNALSFRVWNGMPDPVASLKAALQELKSIKPRSKGLTLTAPRRNTVTQGLSNAEIRQLSRDTADFAADVKYALSRNDVIDADAISGSVQQAVRRSSLEEHQDNLRRALQTGGWKQQAP